MPTASSNAGQRIPRHELYYIHGGDVVFDVENTLFRVHRYFFIRDSLWFHDKLPYPLPPGEITKGSSDNLPLTLEGVSRIDFERLLWVFYNPLAHFSYCLSLLFDATFQKILTLRCGCRRMDLHSEACAQMGVYRGQSLSCSWVGGS
ncbi:hypothetical protein EDB83DRAFT_133343 [Lactarius deliciosus]|nr:hypothetical protein EDB83DRAFT_133343 [Lactarius deliciosus]